MLSCTNCRGENCSAPVWYNTLIYEGCWPAIDGEVCAISYQSICVWVVAQRHQLVEPTCLQAFDYERHRSGDFAAHVVESGVEHVSDNVNGSSLPQELTQGSNLSPRDVIHFLHAAQTCLQLW